MQETQKSTAYVKAALYMLLAMAMWAVIENIPRYFSQHYTTFETVWMRYSIHLLFMLVVFGPRVKLRLVRTQRLGQQIVRGMLMLGMHLAFIFAIRSISVNATMSVFWISPLLLLGLSAWLGERANWKVWAGVAVAFGFVLIILRPVSAAFHPGALLGVLMAVCFVIYLQMTRAMKGEDILASLFYTAFSVWIVLSFVMPFVWVTPNGFDLLLFAAIGLLGYVCIFSFDKAAELAPTWVSAPFAFIQPVLIIISEWTLRNYFPGRLSLGLAGLIVLYLIFILLQNTAVKRLLPGYHHV